MVRSGSAFLLPFLFLTPVDRLSAQPNLPQPQAVASNATPPITIPANAKIELVVIRPVWAASASPGDSLYAQTNFPVLVGNRVAISPGTYVQGTLETVTRPTRKLNRAEFQILFTKIIFANGYTVALAGPNTASGSAPGPDETLIEVDVQVSQANDLLLDNGAQIEMALAAPLTLDANSVSEAARLSRAPQPGQFKSATLCRPTRGLPGSPGSPDTVIPGNPGTPSITIPGGPGMPDTVIPGTPATPPTVIPGMPSTPDTPGTVCPASPMVLSSSPVIFEPAQSQNPLPPAAQ